MKQFLLLILILLLYSCDNIDEGKLIKKVTLANDVGVINIALIPEFDAYKESYSQSDCGCCCAHLIYSFRNKKKDNSPLLDTIPYIHKIENTDSLKIFSFNISHSACKDCNSDGFEINEEFLEIQENKLLQENPHTEIELKEIKMINKQLFAIIGNRTKHPDYIVENIEAVTIFNGEIIGFSGQRINHNKSEFIQNIYTMIKSIELN